MIRLNFLLLILAMLITESTISQSTMKHGLSVGGDTLVIDSIVVSNDTLLFYSGINRYAFSDFNDSIVQIFLTNAGITDSQDSAAVSYLYRALVDSGLWDKYIAIWPIVGDNATSQSFNLVSPYDEDASFRLTYNGTVKHDATGMQVDITSGYANTHLNVPDNLTGDDLHLSFFSVTDTLNGFSYAINVRSLGPETKNLVLSAGTFIRIGEQAVYISGSDGIFMNTNNTEGNYYSTYNDTAAKCLIDGVRMIHDEKTLAGATFEDEEIYLFARNSNGGAAFRTPQKCQFATVGYYMTDDEVFTAAEITRTFQSMLNRGDTAENRYIGREKASFPIAIDSSLVDYTPDSSNAEFDMWDTLDVGALISFQQRSFAGFTSFAYYAHPTQFGTDTATLTDINVGDWVGAADTAGCDYFMFTVMESTGFGWDTMPPFPQRLIDKYDAFTCYDSRTNVFADKNLMQKLADTIRARGKIFGLYINPIRNLLFTPSTGFTWGIFDSLDVVHYNNWLQAYTQALIKKYDPDIFWVDGWAYGPYLDANPAHGFQDLLTDGSEIKAVDFQNLYNAAKEAKPSILYIMNNWCDTTGARLPYDVASNEELVIDIVGETDAQLARDSVWNQYTSSFQWVPKPEFITNVAGDPVTGDGDGFWYATGDEGTTVRNISGVQDIYDRAVAVGAKFCLSIIPGRNGTLQNEQKEIWRNMVW